MTSLLDQGFLTMHMLRNLENLPDLDSKINNFYDETLNSIQNPTYRLIFDVSSLSINEEPSQYDMLSPPLFLNSQNAMGYFKDVNLEDVRTYGAALIEVRAIAHVGEKFLQSIKTSHLKTGSFLRNPREDIPGQMLGLFDFLNNFGEKNFRDFEVGLPELLYNTI